MHLRFIAPLLALGLLLAAPLAAEETTEASPEATDAPVEAPIELRTYQLVFLEVDEDKELPEDQPESRTQRIENGRKYHMQQMIRSGGALIGGDIVDGDALRSVLVMDMEDTAAVQELFDESPGVQNGLLAARVYTWWAADGILRAPTDVEDLVPVWLGLFVRPSKAPRLPPEELERLQAGHLENIGHMHELGDLVIAGPVEGSEDLRGILIFRTAERERIEKLVGEDPLVQAGRLTVELYRWMVPKSSLPQS